MKSKARFNWKDSFISFDEWSNFYIYCDTNASYASIHQFLENGFGKPCVVANGNQKDAGACLAISYEARTKGIKRGASLHQALSICKDLTVYESCLPLYELYADLYDLVLECIVPKEFFYRGSCDEVVLYVDWRRYPYQNFWSAVEYTLDYIKEKLDVSMSLRIKPEQEKDILSLSKNFQILFALSYLIRDCMLHIIGLPISISIAPSICLGKALIDHSKPTFYKGKRLYRTEHDAIAFFPTVDSLNQHYRQYLLKDLCGVHEIAKRFADHRIFTVSDIQDSCDIERSILFSKNVHLGKVVWYMCHGRDDILSGYLSAIRDRK